MIKSHEQQLELRLPRIGVIRKGAPKPQKGPGKDLDHFRLDRAEPTVVAAWNEVLGREPKAISGILPYADPADNLSIWDELWQGKRLLWRGDGERLHVQLNGNNYVRYAPGEGPAQPAAAGESVAKLKVARITHLRILLPQLRIAGIFEIMSSSTIDADELWSNLMWIRSTVPTLQGAPVTVFRAGRQFNVPSGLLSAADGNTMLVTKHMLHMMLDGRYLDALLPAPGAPPQLAAVQPAPALPSGQVDESPDDIEDGNYDDSAEDDDLSPTHWNNDVHHQADEKPMLPADAPTAATFAEHAQSLPAVEAIGFANGRLTDWINFVTDNAYDPTHDALLIEVLNDYCSAVADNGNTHTKAAAEKARAAYRENVSAALASATQSDLFDIEDDPQKFIDPA